MTFEETCRGSIEASRETRAKRHAGANGHSRPGEERPRTNRDPRYTPLLRSAAPVVLRRADAGLVARHRTRRGRERLHHRIRHGARQRHDVHVRHDAGVRELRRGAARAAVVAPGALKRVDGPDPSYPDDVCYAADAAARRSRRLPSRTRSRTSLRGRRRHAGPPEELPVRARRVAGAFCLGVHGQRPRRKRCSGITARDVLVEYDLTGEGRVGMAVTDCAHVLDSSSARGDAAANATAANAATGTAAGVGAEARRGRGRGRVSAAPPPPPPSPPPGSPSAASDSMAPSGYIALVFLVGAGFAVVHYGRRGRGGWTRTATAAARAARRFARRRRRLPAGTRFSRPSGTSSSGPWGARPRGTRGSGWTASARGGGTAWSSRRSSPGGEPEPKVTLDTYAYTVDTN